MSRRPVAYITGMAGFAGSWLAEELVNNGFTVIGTALKGEATDNLRAIRREVSLERLDVLKPHHCARQVARIQPDYLFHLAAVASVGKSFAAERLTLQVNFEGTVNMLEAARASRRLKRFVYISSADCYGRFTPRNKTLTESQPLNPISPYGIGKAAAEQAAKYYHRSRQLPVAIARSFNHTGPRQAPDFVVPAFARQVARIEAGKQPPVLYVGELNARRDFSDVRDIVRGYRLLALKGANGEVYQFCSGRAVSVQRILDTLVRYADKRITVRVDRGRLRPADIPVLRGSNHKAVRRLGWQPGYRLAETLRDTFDYWRSLERSS